MRALHWPTVATAFLLLLPDVAVAQTGSAASSWAIFESDFLVLFRILVVATVVERLLEVLSLGWDASRRRFWKKFPDEAGERAEARMQLATIRKQLVLQGLGILIGIGICWQAQLGLFEQLRGVATGHLGEAVTTWFTSRAGTALDFVATGFLVGLGTEPVHSIIVIILRRRDVRRLKTAS